MKKTRARSMAAPRVAAALALMVGVIVVPGAAAGAGGDTPERESAAAARQAVAAPVASTTFETPQGLVTITLTPDQGIEGSMLTFILDVSGSFSDPISGVMFTAGKGEDLGGSATATSGADYGYTRRSFTFHQPGMFSIDVPTYTDGEVEGDEYFKVLAGNTGAFPPVTFDLRVNGWIIDGDVAGPALSVNDVTVDEGDSGTTDANFTVSLSPATDATVTVEYGTCGVGCTDDATAAFGEDYEITEGTLTFNPGQTSKTVTVPIFGDTSVEDDETFYLVLWNPVAATIDDALGRATIRNDDTAGGPPLCDGVAATIWGDAGANVLIGTAGNDVIVGLGGNDEIRGNGGGDVMCGGDGDDTMIGGPGDDLMFGEAGDDLIKGLTGLDTVYGGPGNDRIQGNAGPDVLDGGDGNDKIWGGVDADLIAGGADNDQLHGGPGPDAMLGGLGTDRIWGDAGDDVLEGHGNSDYLYGGIGEDTMWGGLGNDRMFGWTEDDALYGEDGRDQLRGQAGDDMVDGGPSYDFCSVETVMIACEQAI